VSVSFPLGFGPFLVVVRSPESFGRATFEGMFCNVLVFPVSPPNFRGVVQSTNRTFFSEISSKLYRSFSEDPPQRRGFPSYYPCFLPSFVFFFLLFPFFYGAYLLNTKSMFQTVFFRVLSPSLNFFLFLSYCNRSIGSFFSSNLSYFSLLIVFFFYSPFPCTSHLLVTSFFPRHLFFSPPPIYAIPSVLPFEI